MSGGEHNIVVVPAMDEERFVRDVLRGLRRARPTDDLLVVDDGSRDATPEIAAEEGALVLSLPYRCGYGVALQTGIKFALRHGYETAVSFDADGQHEPKSIDTVLATLREGRADLVVGSRYLGTGFKEPPHKSLAVWVFATLARLGTGERITDPTSGFLGFNRRAMLFYASDLLPEQFPDADAVILASRAGVRVTEVPVTMYRQARKRSMHAGYRALLYVLQMLFSVLVSFLRRDALPEERKA